MPFHEGRTWVINSVESAEALADKLIGHSWCNCQGWSIGRYLFLNDQTSPDGAFEVAIVKVPEDESGPWYQIESVTFGWFEYDPFGKTAQDKALDAINRLISGALDPETEGTVVWEIDKPRVETPEQHGRCHHCA